MRTYMAYRSKSLLIVCIVMSMAAVSFSACVDYAPMDKSVVDREGIEGQPDGWDGDDRPEPQDGDTCCGIDGNDDVEVSDSLDGCVQGIPDGHAVFADSAGGVHETPPGCIDSYGFYRFETNCFDEPNPGFIHMNLDWRCFVFFWLEEYGYEDTCTGTITDFNHLSLDCTRIQGACTGNIDLHAPFILTCKNCSINMEWMGADVCRVK